MNVVLVSQCGGRALPATRRILDQFAERKGSSTWLTPITEAGLETLYGLLRRGARRNTAVACHLVRGGEMELLWIVGNRARFDRRGNVPTDTTARAVLDRYRETGWRHTESIALLAAIAGLFHDFGKASAPFQAKLDGSRPTSHEPWRHEWLSVRLFEAFVGDDSDERWLTRLETSASSDDVPSFDALIRDTADHSRKNPLKRLRDRPLARAVAWLVCSHHRLPIPRRDDEEPHHRARADRAGAWIDDLGPGWVTPRRAEQPSAADWKRLWSFPQGLPVASVSWRWAAGLFGGKASAHADLVGMDWMADPLAMHVARCALMLSDHLYSSGPAREKWQDASYAAYANTRWDDAAAGGPARRLLNQKLDEHCVGVAHEAYRIVKSLPTLRASLPAIGNVRPLRRRSAGRFAWQNRAFEMAERVAEDSRRRGGFFVDMASTGTGKTLANARMAFGLSKCDGGCRFTVLLGLRTLTLQTAESLRRRIGLSASDLAVLVGSTVVRDLHERYEREQAAKDDVGSESAGPLFAEHEYVRYDGELDDSRISRWLDRAGRDGKLHRLVSAPVVVGTIDHVMPATESARGGHQIAPMLRLLCSDLVLDEPDDFDLGDLPALCRLVHWAGLLGSRVLLSSATLPPSLVEALFDAYQSGRQHFNTATAGQALPVVCGWVDEFRVHTERAMDSAGFAAAHARFVDRRLERLRKHEPPRRFGRLVSVAPASSVADGVAGTVLDEIRTLHELHGEISPDGLHKVSVGLVRMANIDPLVQVARAIAETGCASMDVHLCVYHARHPLYRRARIERVLDDLLDRHKPDRLWEHPSVEAARRRERRDQVFVVLATAVAEVGRDHCYDWAIVEPSSMRSIVQLVGRVLRHRVDRFPEAPNIALLRQNVLALRGQAPAFTRPGYEKAPLLLASHDLDDVLEPEHYVAPGAASRLREPNAPESERSLVDLEHVATRRTLDGVPSPGLYPASLWWKEATWWSYALQARTRFRAGEPTGHYALVADEREAEPRFELFTEGEWVVSDRFVHEEIRPADGILPWPSPSDSELLSALDEEHDEPLDRTCRQYLSVSLRTLDGADVCSYDPWVGVHRRGRD